MKSCFIDVHCHLDSLSDIDKVVEHAKKQQVNIIVTQGTNVETNRKAFELSEEFPEVKLALGMYPVEGVKISSKDLDKEIDFIRKNKKQVVAIGEVGLDLKELDSLDIQSKVFQKMIDLALELDVPIIVHSRKAELQCIEMLEKSKIKKVIMHCFCGKFSLVKRIVENGWSLSIPTSVRHSTQFQDTIKLVPIEQLFCETDSPYLHPNKEFPNEPGNVVESYKKIAEIKGLGLEETKNQIFENFKMLFE